MNALNDDLLNAHKRHEEKKKPKETKAYEEMRSKINFSVFIIFFYLFLFLLFICHLFVLVIA